MAEDKPKLKVGILLVGIGKYIQFMESIIDLARKNFLPSCDKTFYIFTDQPDNSINELGDDIHLIYQQNLGWPLNAMWRNKIFTLDKNWNLIKDNDYLFFFNADSLIVNEITEEEFLPTGDKDLIAVKHSVHRSIDINRLPFEKNENSSVCINESNKNKGLGYFVSGVFGGKTNSFYETCNKICSFILEDLNKGIIPVWHDESVFNYIVHSSPDKFKILSREYCFSIEDVIQEQEETVKILIRPKYLVGGRFNLRSLDPSDMNSYVYKDSLCSNIVTLEYKDGLKERLKISNNKVNAFRCKWLTEVELIKNNYNSIAFIDNNGKLIEFLPSENKTYKEYSN